MSINYTETVPCPLCGYKENEPYTYEEVVFRKLNIRLGINKCVKCSLIYTSPRLNPEGLAILYNELYAVRTVSGVYSTSFDVSGKEYLTFKKYVYKILPQGGRILDIGCGTGNFLAQFKYDKRYIVEGVECSEYAGEEAKHKGIKVHLGDISKLNLPSRYYDCVCLLYVLEHFPKPLSLLKEIHRLLKIDGYCLIAVPNFNYLRLIYTGLASRLLFGKQTHLHTEEHLQNFTPKTLSAMVNKAGFSIIGWGVASSFNVGSLPVRIAKKIISIIIHCLFYLGVHLGGIHLIVKKKAENKK